jgi:sugar-specific transcriptional regulator TrmB
MPKTTVYDCLEELLEKGIVISYPNHKTTLFGVNNPDSIKHELQKESRQLESLIGSFDSLLQTTPHDSAGLKPKIRFYEGQSGIQQALYDIIAYQNIDLYTMWPMQKMIDAVGGDFILFHNNKRVERNTRLYAIRHANDKQAESFSNLSTQKEDKEFLRETRFAPSGYDWNMGMVVYNDSCLFASGGNDLFAYIIQSKEFAELMKLQWRSVWEISK